MTTATTRLSAFVGRQPIFDGRQRVHGYELLFRVGEQAGVPRGHDGCSSTAGVVLNAFVEIGLDSVVGERPAFINATRAFLCDGLAHQLPAARVVIEVLEDVPADAEVIAALEKLRAGGYRIALDDFVYNERLSRLVDLADLIKIDLSRLSHDEIARHVDLLRRPGLQLLAERVETFEDFERCKALGFDYFQGFFLARPSVVSGQRRTSNHVAALRLLALLENPNVAVDQVETAMSVDPTLSFRLLRVINSAAFGLRRRVDSIRQALVLLGLGRVHAWVTLMVLAGLSRKPPVLLETALTRARMCERLATLGGLGQGPAFFTVGLFSALDAMLDAPMPEIVAQLPLSDEVVAALVRGEGTMGSVLRAVLAYERCEWDRVALGTLGADDFRQAYLDTLQWVREIVTNHARFA
jgi:EAL and modified HD-GYP domain-containing signal transduction protein